MTLANSFSLPIPSNQTSRLTLQKDRSQTSHLQPMPEHPECGSRPLSAGHVQLWCVLVGQIRNLAAHDGRQALQLVHQHQVLEGTGTEEECVALFQRDGAAEFGLVVVVTQVGDLVQVAAGEEVRLGKNLISTCVRV